MNYMGGKQRIARRIAEVILQSTPIRTAYAEPFLGGGSTAAELSPQFGRVYLSDAHTDLMMLWEAVVYEGYDPPSEISEDEYLPLRDSLPSALRSFAGFGCSFGGKWFGGYARSRGANMAERARRQLLRKAGQMIRCPEPILLQADYREMSEIYPEQSVIYCDPPYRRTERYRETDDFDSEEFWSVVGSWADDGHHVFVSEESAPGGWYEIWQADVPLQVNGGSKRRRVERLYTR